MFSGRSGVTPGPPVIGSTQEDPNDSTPAHHVPLRYALPPFTGIALKVVPIGSDRLALTIIDGSLFRAIISILGSEKESQKKKRELIDLFIVKSDLFWSSHYTFRSAAHAPLYRLVGRSRGADIVLNTVIPLALLYARIFKLREIREKTLALYKRLPASGGNSIVNLIMGQVLRNSYPVGFAWEHQGVLQLHNFYCSEGRCAECTIGARLALTSSRCR